MKTIIYIFLLVGLNTFLISCNFFSTHGKAVLIYRDSIETMDRLVVEGPYNYYVIDWKVVSDIDSTYRIGAKGMTKFDLCGKNTSRTNYYRYNKFDVNEINKKLSKIEVDKPYLFWEFNNETENRKPSRIFLIITKNHELFYNETALIQLAGD